MVRAKTFLLHVDNNVKVQLVRKLMEHFSEKRRLRLLYDSTNESKDIKKQLQIKDSKKQQQQQNPINIEEMLESRQRLTTKIYISNMHKDMYLYY